MLWIYDLPTWLLAVLIVTVFLALAVGGLLLSRHFVTKRLIYSREINDAVNYFGTAIAALYSVTLGLIAVATWADFSTVGGLVSREAATIGVLYRDMGGYPEPLATELRRGLREYTVFVVEKVWPAQQKGILLDQPTAMLTTLHEKLMDYEPPTSGKSIMHAETMRRFNELLDLRRQRIDRVDDGLPAVVWVVVWLGGIIILGVSYLFWIEDIRFHILLLSLLTVFVALMVFLIAALDRPFRGQVSVSPDSYTTIIERVMDPLDAARAKPSKQIP